MGISYLVNRVNALEADAPTPPGGSHPPDAQTALPKEGCSVTFRKGYSPNVLIAKRVVTKPMLQRTQGVLIPRRTNSLPEGRLLCDVPEGIQPERADCEACANEAYASTNLRGSHPPDAQTAFPKEGCSVTSRKGFEPPTVRLEGACSIQLSYRDIR